MTTPIAQAEAVFGLELPTIPLSVFEARYLPLLFHPNASTFNTAWVEEVAMSIFMEVEVLNADDTVAFRVPALRPHFSTGFSGDISAVGTRSVYEAGIHKVKGNAYLSRTLPQVLLPTASTTDNEERWREIITRCGYGSKLADRTYTTPVSTSSSESSGGISLDEEW